MPWAIRVEHVAGTDERRDRIGGLRRVVAEPAIVTEDHFDVVMTGDRPEPQLGLMQNGRECAQPRIHRERIVEPRVVTHFELPA